MAYKLKRYINNQLVLTETYNDREVSYNLITLTDKQAENTLAFSPFWQKRDTAFGVEYYLNKEDDPDKFDRLCERIKQVAKQASMEKDISFHDVPRVKIKNITPEGTSKLVRSSNKYIIFIAKVRYNKKGECMDTFTINSVPIPNTARDEFFDCVRKHNGRPEVGTRFMLYKHNGIDFDLWSKYMDNEYKKLVEVSLQKLNKS